MNPPIQPTAEQREAAENYYHEKRKGFAYPADMGTTMALAKEVDDLALFLASREKEAYQRGRTDRDESHDTEQGFCCACGYDIAGFEQDKALAAYSASQASKKECGCEKCLKALE